MMISLSIKYQLLLNLSHETIEYLDVLLALSLCIAAFTNLNTIYQFINNSTINDRQI